MFRVIAVLALALLMVCDSARATAERPPVALRSGESLTLLQRSTMALPGTTDLLLTIGDISAGQSTVSLEWRDGEPLIGPRSVRPDETLDFSVAGEAWQLTLAYLHNELIGDDWAQFKVARVGNPQRIMTAAQPTLPNAAQEIEALIAAVESLNGGVFIRNGQEHNAKDAANHLRRKLRAAGKRVKSAEDFIQHIASKSSSSGNPYALRLPSGKTVDAGEWFRAQLQALRTVRT